MYIYICIYTCRSFCVDPAKRALPNCSPGPGKAPRRRTSSELCRAMWEPT